MMLRENNIETKKLEFCYFRVSINSAAMMNLQERPCGSPD
jgi:hypothetical protein